jgi:hypothetical protein
MTPSQLELNNKINSLLVNFNTELYYSALGTCQNSYDIVDIFTITGFMKTSAEKINHLLRYTKYVK